VFTKLSYNTVIAITKQGTDSSQATPVCSKTSAIPSHYIFGNRKSVLLDWLLLVNCQYNRMGGSTSNPMTGSVHNNSMTPAHVSIYCHQHQCFCYCYSMEHRTSSEANRSSDVREISAFHKCWRFITVFIKACKCQPIDINTKFDS
jgi:hypothetical protein